MTKIRSHYSEAQIREMEREIAPLWKQYHAAPGSNRNMNPVSFGRLRELSNALVDHITKKTWETRKEYFDAVGRADQFEMFFHRESVRFRAIRFTRSYEQELRDEEQGKKKVMPKRASRIRDLRRC